MHYDPIAHHVCSDDSEDSKGRDLRSAGNCFDQGGGDRCAGAWQWRGSHQSVSCCSFRAGEVAGQYDVAKGRDQIVNFMQLLSLALRYSSIMECVLEYTISNKQRTHSGVCHSDFGVMMNSVRASFAQT